MKTGELSKENKMGVMPEGRLLINMSLPMMISMLVQAMYNIVDTYFVTKLGQPALNAVSYAFPLQTLMIAIAAGTGVGVNALISRGLGEKNQKRVNKVAANGLLLYILSYILVALLGVIVVNPFYNLSTQSAETREFGVTYLSIVLVGSFGIYAQFLFERLLQATGRTFYTMISQAVGAIINIIFDPLLIFGIGIFPKMGIAGAAVATVLGQVIAAIIAFVFNKKFNPDVHLSMKGFRPDGRIIADIYKIGFPSIIMQSIGSVMVCGMNLIMKGYDDAVSVFGLYFKLQSFFFMPIFGLNNGLIPILSYNFGARNKKRMMNTLRYGYLIAFIFMMVGFAGFMIVPDKLLQIFMTEVSIIEMGVPALRIISVHFWIAWYCIVTGTLFQAVGNAVYSLYVSVARQLVVLLPAAYILVMIGGINYIWWSFPIAEVMSFVISTICLRNVFKTQLNNF